MIDRVKKRNGTVVEFDRSRIERAIEKACIATVTHVEENFITSITDEIISTIERYFEERIPGVEDIQDIVESKIAGAGLFEVAKAYILYRKERERAREEEKQKLLERIEKDQQIMNYARSQAGKIKKEIQTAKKP